MGSTIIKASKDEDFYVLYSSVVDSPTWHGTRTEMERYFPSEAKPERFERADRTGSSCAWVTPPEFGWNDPEVTIREGIDLPENAWCARIKRADLKAFCLTLGDDGEYHPPASLVTYDLMDEEDR